MTLLSTNFTKLVVVISLAIATYNPWSGLAAVSAAIALLAHEALSARAKALLDSRNAQIDNLQAEVNQQRDILHKLVEEMKRHNLGKLTR